MIELVTDTLGWTGPELWPFIGAGLWIFAADLLWQARRARPDLEVLFMSGYTEDSDGFDSLDDPTVALIPKPFSTDQLLRKLREVLT